VREIRSNSNINVQRSGDVLTITALAVPYGKWGRVREKSGTVFMERIERGALKTTLASGEKIICTVNHDYDSPLADTRSGLILKDEPDGLHFDLRAGNDRVVQVIDGVRKGFFNHCSFTFRKTDWKDEIIGGVTWRKIFSMELFEVCLTDTPVYRQSTAQSQGGTGYRGSGDTSILTAREDNHIQFSAHSVFRI